MFCKYIGENESQPWKRGLVSCENEVRSIADKSEPSKSWKTKHGHTVMWPSKKCPSGFCEYHYNKLKFKKLGIGRQS